LLCEFHAHTTWSDGALTVRELCDLYGRRGFDVLAVTDHAPREVGGVAAGNYDAYLADVRTEALRARELYELLVIPGLEVGRPGASLGEARRATRGAMRR
jgi:histidinol phosphatase-like PHP family hydrolase